MRKIIVIFFIGCLLIVGLNGCGVKRPLYQKPTEQPNSQTQFNS